MSQWGGHQRGSHEERDRWEHHGYRAETYSYGKPALFVNACTNIHCSRAADVRASCPLSSATPECDRLGRREFMAFRYASRVSLCEVQPPSGLLQHADELALPLLRLFWLQTSDHLAGFYASRVLSPYGLSKVWKNFLISFICSIAQAARGLSQARALSSHARKSSSRGYFLFENSHLFFCSLSQTRFFLSIFHCLLTVS